MAYHDSIYCHSIPHGLGYGQHIFGPCPLFISRSDRVSNSELHTQELKPAISPKAASWLQLRPHDSRSNVFRSGMMGLVVLASKTDH